MTDRWLEYLPLAELRPNPANAKRHSIGGIGTSMTRLGYIEPVAIDERTGLLISGHGRVETLIDARDGMLPAPDGVTVAADGTWLVPVNRGWSSADDAEAAAALVALNHWTEVGGWDPALLYDQLTSAAGADLLEVTGFADDELAGLLAAGAEENPEPPAGRGDPDEVPEPPALPVTKPGDVWLLGGHTICPDCGHKNLLGQP